MDLAPPTATSSPQTPTTPFKSRLPPRRLPPPSPASPVLSSSQAPLQAIVTAQTEIQQPEQTVQQPATQLVDQDNGASKEVNPDGIDLRDGGAPIDSPVSPPPRRTDDSQPDKVAELVEELCKLKLKASEIEVQLLRLNTGQEKVDKGKIKAEDKEPAAAANDGDGDILLAQLSESSSVGLDRQPAPAGSSRAVLPPVLENAGSSLNDSTGGPKVESASSSDTDSSIEILDPSSSAGHGRAPVQGWSKTLSHSFRVAPDSPGWTAPATAPSVSFDKPTSGWTSFQEAKDDFARADDSEVLAYLQHLEARNAQLQAEVPEQVDLLLARIKKFSAEYDQALADKAILEGELEEVKERAAAKVRRVEERWADKLEAKEKEIEALKYRLNNGLLEDVKLKDPIVDDGFSSFIELDGTTSATAGFSSAASLTDNNNDSPRESDVEHMLDSMNEDVFLGEPHGEGAVEDFAL
ncbi:hypothetical protein JCM6882_004282 [Rhodosporidiobolus microsporus]